MTDNFECTAQTILGVGSRNISYTEPSVFDEDVNLPAVLQRGAKAKRGLIKCSKKAEKENYQSAVY
jgi:hypothetical protein